VITGPTEIEVAIQHQRLNLLERAMAMKYVMLKLEGGQLLPVIFPNFMQHAQIAGSIPAAVVSAGRVHLEGGNIHVNGASSSLGVSSREEDSQIIQTYFDKQHALQHER
jgi:hypothetical protein